MRLLLPLLLLAGCVSLPPTGNPCQSLTYPGGAPASGLGAKFTVQHMLLQKATLINGKPAEPSDWPASVYARVPGGACSATIVGDRSLFIASHCVPGGGIVSFSAHANSYSARCTNHPSYKTNTTADWTLCLIDRPVTGIPFEVLGTGERLAVGDTVTLSGYGCIQPGGGGGNDGIFRVGDATIQGMPNPPISYDVVTRGGGALCFGDSGGSAYHVHSDGSRFIFGVNSRGDIQTISYIPGVFDSAFVSWAKVWARANNNVKICGIHPEAAGCRYSTPAADGKFELVSKPACIKGVVNPDYLGKKNEIMDRVQKALQQPL